jgi:hypothetical protein
MQAILYRHQKIHHDHVGLQLTHPLNGFSTVFGFPTDPPIRILLKKVPQRGPDGRAVVDYKNANCGNLLGFN